MPSADVRAAGIQVVPVHPSSVVPRPVILAPFSPVIPGLSSPVILSPGVSKAFLPLSAFPVMTVAILCVWATHTSPGSPEAAATSTASPEAAVTAKDPLEVAVIAPELAPVCPDTTTEVVSELCLPRYDHKGHQ